MGAIVDRADALADAIRGAGVRATTDVRHAVPPCVLVVPVPQRVYDVACGYTVTWTIVALAPGTGDRNAALVLEDLVDAVAGAVDVEQADPGAYRLPTAEDPLPAYIMRSTETATEA